jgi:hypothetical protein
MGPGIIWGEGQVEKRKDVERNLQNHGQGAGI